jgi:hypothetical protein
MTKINPITYYVHDCILRGWGNVGYAFDAWSRVIRSDYSAYDVYDNTKYPYTQEEKEKATSVDFWDYLEDDIYTKEFLEYLLGLVEEVENGTAKLVPFNIDEFIEGDDE